MIEGRGLCYIGIGQSALGSVLLCDCGLKESLAFDVAFDKFCDGFVNPGPYWEHVVEYVEASLKFPNTVFLIRYEDLMERPVHNVKKLADFIEQPFSMAEEDQGVVERIVSFCSFDKLSNLKVNKTETYHSENTLFTNDTFFRYAKVGDWQNHLNDEQRERIDGITRQKFKDIGSCLSDYLSSI
uniref:Sulfotransferase n=1 Tax=Kalanchoe fedtschenkoi TaxID=63787 RepID=A0A7N0TDA3_KALFE